MYWFTADTHFGHSNIIKFCNRPFQNVEEMDEALIENWNKNIKEDDTVYHLGDFKFKKSENFLRRLNGYKILIEGNHDKNSSLKDGWSEIYQYKKIVIDYKDIILFHYPIREWDQYYRKSWHLYGHVHNNVKPLEGTNSLDVGVDANNYEPISFDYLESIFT